MRIGIDLQVLGQRPWTGVGKYVHHLSEALKGLKTQHEFIFFPPSPRGIPLLTNHFLRARQMQQAKLDVLHGPANVLPLFFSVRTTRCVVTVHDLAIYKYPEWFPSGQWFSTKVVVPRSIKKADAIIVPSEATKRDLVELFRIGENKIHVIAHGVEERFFKISNQFPNINDQKYILFVGTVEERKNVGRLIEAYRGLAEDIRAEYKLVIAGSHPRNSRYEIRDTDIRFLDYVSDEDLPSLYQNAALFVYPSLYEGFGLPVLEAMAAGVPVVTSKDSAMAGFAGSDAILVDPCSVEEIQDAMQQMLGPLSGPLTPADYGRALSLKGRGVKGDYALWRDEAYSSQISTAGIDFARKFNWEKTARETLRVYEQIFAKP